LLSTQQIILTTIVSIQSQIQILTNEYQQLENRVDYLEEQVNMLNNKMAVMESSMENMKIEMESEIENLRIEITENIKAIISSFENLKARVDDLEVGLSAVENNLNAINNQLNVINSRLFVLEQMLKVPSGFPAYTVKVKLVDENFNDIIGEKIWLIMANGRILENTTPAVFDNVIADKVVVRYGDLRYEFVLNKDANILIMIKDNIPQVMTMVRINVELKDNVAEIIIDGGKYIFWTSENQITIWLPVGEHTIEVKSGGYSGEMTLTGTHEPTEQYIELQKAEGIGLTTKILLALSIMALLMLMAIAVSRRRYYRLRW
jgi:molecular chaperone GrpE (heat shock protein)